ncbi:hypothetical protein BKA70DRAFT_1324314 [Coprinopsis sp. MPI-PUGE-AT-0042]|nr:hypothetical protein BKA70DRAFT_1324314 [Coprinopsis sp. MPI-PUGE-AT-0042]
MQGNPKRKGSGSDIPRTLSKKGRWEDDLGLPPAECSPTASGSALISGVHTAQIHGGAFSMIGRDSITVNNNYGHHVISVDILEILNSLPLPNFRDIQQDTIAKATEGTCLWFTTGDMFIFWIKEGKILWGIGIPGAGKTILASIVIRYLEQLERTSNGNIYVAYVYLRYSEPLAIRDILESFVKQIVERHPDVGFLIESLYALHKRERTKPSQHDLVGLLSQLAASGKTLIFLLDALDELQAEDRPILLGLLMSLNAKLFITSRPLETLQRRFPQAQVFDIAARPSDIDLHIREFLRHSPDLVELLEGSGFEERIIEAVHRKSGAMFLHAKLQLEALRHCISIQDVEETLEEFPTDIVAIYMKTWERVIAQPPKHASLAKLVFLWILHAPGEMTIGTLRRMVATHPDTHVYDSKRLVPEAMLVSVCCGLVLVDEKTRLVRLIHYTTRDAILPRVLGLYPFPHSIPTLVCLAHLASCGFQDASKLSADDLNNAAFKDPLLAYAYPLWAHHANECKQHELVTTTVMQFVLKCVGYPLVIHGQRDFLGPLHLSAFFGFEHLIQPAANLQSPNLLTPITRRSTWSLAWTRSHYAFAHALLSLTGFDVNLEDGWDRTTPLVDATLKGMGESVELLLKIPGLNINTISSPSKIVILKQSTGRESNLMELFNDAEALRTAKVEGGLTALAIACRNADIASLRLILDIPGIDVDVSCMGGTALIWACRNGDASIVKFLLEVPGVEVNAVDNWRGLTALTWATERGYTGIVELLLAFPGIRIRR